MSVQKHHVMRLLKNQLYPTYQLYALMASKKTSPQDGLRYAALTVIQWLRERLQDDAPPELQLPEPDQYLKVTDDQLVSTHIHHGYVIDIISMPTEGIWSLMLTEPDLGSDPGNPGQERQAVPGRVFETHIGFHIQGQQLECGFKTVISDPENVDTPADVYRLAIVRRLMLAQEFGLRQCSKLTDTPETLSTVKEIRSLLGLLKDERNQIPTVVFTHARRKSPAQKPVIGKNIDLKAVSLPPLTCSSFMRSIALPIPIDAPKEAPKLPESFLPYDAEQFAKECFTLCRTYILADESFERFQKESQMTIAPGDVLLYEPSCFGGERHSFPYPSHSDEVAETMDKLYSMILPYPRGRNVSYGTMSFIESARLAQKESVENIEMDLSMVCEAHDLNIASLKEKHQAELSEKDAKYDALLAQMERQKQYADRLEQEKADLLAELAGQKKQYEDKLHEEDESVAYLRRKLDRPTSHDQIAAWVQKYFPGRLLLHQKAISLLEDKSAQEVDLDLICDALDYLATDYWEQRYLQIPKETAMTRCAEKYGRPFEVKPTGEQTIQFTPAAYKIKYFPGARGKPVETPLDYHLGVGNSPENLLRIYFLHDDKEQLIVIGSLPRHLKVVGFKV